MPIAAIADVAPMFARQAQTETLWHSAPSAQFALQDLDCVVRELGASWQNGLFAWQRRRGHRTPFAAEMILVPMDNLEDGENGRCLVTGKEISSHGISFSHARPISSRLVAITCKLPDGGCATILTRLKWCRFTKAGVYESGGEFLRIISEDSFA